MFKKLAIFSILIFCLAAGLPGTPARAAGQTPRAYMAVQRASIPALRLEWQRGGCPAWGCETGWYSSPALVDVNGDGRLDVIAAAYTLWALDATNKQVLWSSSSPGGGRIWPGIVVADIDKDGATEIVTANSKGYLTVYRLNGTQKWQAQPTTSELRGLLAADLDGNGSSLELVVTAAISNRTSTWVYNTDGGLSVRSGWPQLSDANGYAAGVYNANAAAGNLDASNPGLELIVPTDVHYILGYKPDGSPLPANSGEYPGRSYWGLVGVWENLAFEKSGGSQCASNLPRSQNYRPNFADSPAVIADVNADGMREVVVAGSVYDCSYGSYPVRYTGPYIFNKDRSRFNAGGFDWRSTPVDTGAPLSMDWTVIETAVPNPVVADLDGDGKSEILYAANDGKLHAFWLDKSEHGSWPFQVNQAGEGFLRFASEPVVADLDNDGKAEVIFTSWTSKGSNTSGRLHILNSQGNVLQEVTLPINFGGDYNGALPAPTLGNVDADANLEIVINTVHSGVVVYDLPGITNARILWGTGRGSYLRDGAR